VGAPSSAADDLNIAPASADASFRRYFRIGAAPNLHRHGRAAGKGRRTAVLARREVLHAAGVHAPSVLAEDVVNGYLLLSDLGAQTYLTC